MESVGVTVIVIAIVIVILILRLIGILILIVMVIVIVILILILVSHRVLVGGVVAVLWRALSEAGIRRLQRGRLWDSSSWVESTRSEEVLRV